MISENDLDKLATSADQNLCQLSTVVMDGKKPPPGPYAFFHHSSHSLERLQDCRRVCRRLFEGRREYNALAYQEERLLPQSWPAGKPFPPEVQSFLQKQNVVVSYLRQDFETLYMFGGILLDQWSLQTVTVGNVPLPRGEHPFRELVQFLEKGQTSLLDPLWEQIREDILWLHYQIRYYRNKFVVHANRPWQRGSDMAVFGEDFRLYTPTPPGWLDDNSLNNEINELRPLAAQVLPIDVNQLYMDSLIEALFNNIGKIQNGLEREKVAGIFGKKGGHTPTFQLIARNFFSFISKGTEVLIKIAKTNMSQINLGEPFSQSSLL